MNPFISRQKAVDPKKTSFALALKPALFSTVCLLLLALLTACSSGGVVTPPTGKTTTVPHGSISPTTGHTPTVTPTPEPSIKLGVQPCPEAVKDPAYWNAIIGTQPNVSSVSRVTCGNLTGNPSLQALILVNYSGTGQIIDVYVFNNITDPHPTQLLRLQSLYKGDARISGYNTITSAEVDQNSSINKGQPDASLTQDLFREFKWSSNANTFVPVSFPGLFPDLTRYQAESDQAQVNQGHDPWKLSATSTAQALAASANLLKWSANAPATIISGGGQHDVNAVVKVQSTSHGNHTITVTMSRLEGNTNGGIWIATSVTSDSISIITPQSRNILTSPVTVTGTGSAFEGVIGAIFILDHLYTPIGQTQARGAIGNGATTFTTSVSYNTTFHTGAQEGILALYAYSNLDGSIYAAILIKELLS